MSESQSSGSISQSRNTSSRKRQRTTLRGFLGRRAPSEVRPMYGAVELDSIRPPVVWTETPPEVTAEEFNGPVETPPWRRSGLAAEVEAIVMASPLAPLVDALGSVAEPRLPLEATLLKACALVGCALSGARNYKPEQAESMDWSKIENLGKSLARVVIRTGGGQVPSFWGLVVGRSAMGKDIGDIMTTLAAAKGWWLGQSGSAEGLQDAMIEKPSCLLTIGELIHWLDAKHWQSKAKGWLTDAFGRGYFQANLSKRGGGGKERRSPYCYPNVLANVQMETIAKFARTLDKEQGFLPRFMVSVVPETNWVPTTKDISGLVDMASASLDRYAGIGGEFLVPDGYSRHLLDLFEMHNAPEQSHWRRLCNEYLPRLALMLEPPAPEAEPAADSLQRTIHNISQGALEKAEKVVLWHFAQAEQVFAQVEDDSRTASQEGNLRKIVRQLRQNGAMTARQIANNIRGVGYKAQRTAMLNELLERGLVTKEGAYFRLNDGNLPPGW